ncbi:MAG: flavodoxin family protein [Oscillospiraceae bacterium]|jgi:multimeric flavodoxin WrbA|nr:flavodoxin family protein [Oscillospiraceae bacterium]
MNILVISGSPRRGGNTEIMAEAFAKGARESGNTVAIEKMSSLTVAPCLDCEYCFSHDGVCVQHDGMTEILKAFDQADMVVFASPIYWFNVTAQIKAVIDRLYARAQKGMHPSSSALLLDSGSPGVFGGAVAAYKDTVKYLHWSDRGIYAISGMKSKGAMKDSPDLKKVADFGRSLK